MEYHIIIFKMFTLVNLLSSPSTSTHMPENVPNAHDNGGRTRASHIRLHPEKHLIAYITFERSFYT